MIERAEDWMIERLDEREIEKEGIEQLNEALRRFEWVKRKGEAVRLSQRHRIVSPRRTRRARRSQKLIESHKNPPLGTPQLAREFFTLRVLRALRGEFFVTSGLASQPASVPREPK